MTSVVVNKDKGVEEVIESADIPKKCISLKLQKLSNQVYM